MLSAAKEVGNALRVKHVFEGNVKISVALGTCKYDSGGCERIRIAASASSMRH
jgi:hypothetical protein